MALGSGVAATLGAQVGDHIRIAASKGSPQTLTVVAIYEAGLPPIDKARVYVNLVTAQRILNRPSAIGRIEIRLKNPFQSKELA